MVLAAGRGQRMRPLTDTCPKPLLPLGGKPLMQWLIEALARGGVRDVLVNTDWLGAQIEAYFARPQSPPAIGRSDPTAGALPPAPVRLTYSREGDDFGAALETAGGIVRGLPYLADPFWLLAGDVFVPGFRFSADDVDDFMAGGKLARIWLVPNPEHNPGGDFALSRDGLGCNDGPVRHTYSTIGLYRHALFAPPYCAIGAGNPHGTKAALAPLLRQAAAQGLVEARLYTGPWADVGTPERLAALDARTAPHNLED